MSFNQSRSDKGETEYRKTGRSASFNHNSGSGRGGGGAATYGRGSGVGPQASGNRSFKKYNYNAQGGQQQTRVGVPGSGSSGGGVNAPRGVQNGAASQLPQSHGISNATFASAVAKPAQQLATQGSSGARPVAMAPAPLSPAVSSDATAPRTPGKNAGETSQAFQLQFGSISPGCVNRMQIPARTSSAPPNLDEQKRDQARHTTVKTSPALPPSLPQHQLPRKDVGVVDQSNYRGGPQPTSRVKEEFQGSLAPSLPLAENQVQKPPSRPVSGISMQMPYGQTQVSVPYTPPSVQLQSQGIAAPSLSVHMHKPMPMGNAPQIPQQMFIPGLQPHAMQTQGIIHQGQSLTFTNQIGPLPHQLGSMGFSPQYTQQQGAKYGGQRKTVVKITDPNTHEELKFDKRTGSHADGVSSGPRVHSNMPPQSQPNASFPTTHPANYYPSSYSPSVHITAPSSRPVSTSQITSNSQAPRISSNSVSHQASQNVSFINSSHSFKDATKAGTPVNEALSVRNVAPTEALGPTQFAPAGTSGDKNVKTSVSTSTSAVEKIESPRKPPLKVNSNIQSQKESGPPSLEHKSINSKLESVAGSAESLASTTVLPSSSPVITTEGRQRGTIGESSSINEQKPEVAAPSSVHSDSVPESSKEPQAGKDVSAGEGFTHVSTERSVAQTSGDASQSVPLAAEMESKRITDNVRASTLTSTGSVDAKNVPSSLVSSIASGISGLTLDDSSSLKESMGSNEYPAANIDVSDVSLREGESVDRSVVREVSRPASGSKEKPNSDLKSPTSTRGRKKMKEILQKADAQGTNSDLYMAYKGPEERKEDSASLQRVENVPGSVNPKHEPSDILPNVVAREKAVKTKTEPDDWEDAADISSPKLETSGKDQPHGKGGSGDESMAKRYSRDFLLKFAEQFTSLPEGFEVTVEVAGALVSSNVNISHLVDNGSYSSPVRGIDRQSGGPRLDRRGSNLGGDDSWNKSSAQYGINTGFRPVGVQRNPRSQVVPQFSGGILPGPMQNLGHHAGLQRNSSDADRWHRGANFQQKGLITSPHTPLQMMHKAEKKYQVGKVSDEEEAKQRQLKGILNKLTPQNFQKLFEQVKAVNIDNVDTLTGVISQIFDKALMEPTFCEMYANFCSHLAGELPDFSADNEKITFKRLLLNKCQEEFERGEREQEEANKSEEGESKLTDQEREERRINVRRRMLGNIRLIGELYKKKMLTERIMHECIKKLFGQDEVPDEEDIEALCKLMSTIGEMIDHYKAKDHMDAYFERMTMLSDNMKLSSRVRFMLKDVIDLRKNKWQQRRKVEGPKKIDEVHRDAAQERHLQGSRSTRGASINSSARRGPAMDFGSRGPAMHSPGAQMGGLRGLAPQVRGYGNQDSRFERHAFEARTLSSPWPQRLMGDESITLGPQGGLARGMASGRGSAQMSSSLVPENFPGAGDSRRLGPGFNGHSSVSDRAPYGAREEHGPRSMQDRYASPASQESNLSYSNRDPRRDRTVPSSPHLQGEHPTSVQTVASENALPEERLQDMSMSAIKEFYSARDEKEVALCVKDMNSPSFHPSMVALWITDSFERKDMERDLLAKLLVGLTKSPGGALSQLQLVNGFESVLSTLEDAVTDAPKAPEFLGRLFAKGVLENVVSLDDIGRLLYEGGEESGSLRKVGLAADVLGSTLEAIKLEKGEGSLNEIRGSSNLSLEEFQPPASYKSKKFELFM